MTVDAEDQGRRAEWNETSTGWLNLMIPALQAHAVRVANGDVGVLDVNVETDEMQVVLSGRMAVDKTTQKWHPLANFVAMIRAGVGSRDCATLGEGDRQINPTRDLALFLHNEPDAQGRWGLSLRDRVRRHPDRALKFTETLTRGCQPIATIEALRSQTGSTATGHVIKTLHRDLRTLTDAQAHARSAVRSWWHRDNPPASVTYR